MNFFENLVKYRVYRKTFESLNHLLLFRKEACYNFNIPKWKNSNRFVKTDRFPEIIRKMISRISKWPISEGFSVAAKAWNDQLIPITRGRALNLPVLADLGPRLSWALACTVKSWAPASSPTRCLSVIIAVELARTIIWSLRSERR